jgi:3-methyladenine DNA glycosylase/8-oxoguanine DNA glycosylase
MAAAHDSSGEPRHREVKLNRPLDLRRTLQPMRRGVADRCTVVTDLSVWRATRTPQGPVTLCMTVTAPLAVLRVSAWGPGAAWALDHAPAIAGADDRDDAFDALLAAGRGRAADVLRALRRRMPGLRIPSSGAVTEALVPSVLEQKVTGLQARRSYQHLVRSLGEQAPGPVGARGPDGGPGMLVPPPAPVWAATPVWTFHRAGVERKRAATLATACRYAHRLDRDAHADPAGTADRLGRLPGIGPWTVAEVARVALGDADAVSVGDYHLKNTVTWALAGRPRGTDDDMLELLEPYKGHRGRVTRLLEAAGIVAPRYGPRLTIQPIAAI